jgi:hypothetical protein
MQLAFGVNEMPSQTRFSQPAISLPALSGRPAAREAACPAEKAGGIYLPTGEG